MRRYELLEELPRGATEHVRAPCMERARRRGLAIGADEDIAKPVSIEVRGGIDFSTEDTGYLRERRVKCVEQNPIGAAVHIGTA